MFGHQRAPNGEGHALAIAVRVVVALLPLMLLGCGGDYPQSTIDPVSGELGPSIQDLYRTIFWWCLFILAIVWTLLAYILIRFRERPDGPEPRQTRGNLLLEVGWTLGPAVIVVLITVPTIQTVFRTQAPAPEDALQVEVVGHQWWWEFRYPGQGVITANEIHVPVGRPVELLLSSADVIHSFWVPRVGGKRDVNPRVRKPEGVGPSVNRLVFTVNEAGVYHGQCAEFCGLSHGLMGLRLVAQEADEFDQWVRAMNEPVGPDSGTVEDRGREIFLNSVCVACHAIKGTRAGGRLGPDLTRLGARRTLGAGLLENTPENLIEWIRDPRALKPGARMPGIAEGAAGMPPTGLSEEELEAVAAYLSSLR